MPKEVIEGAGSEIFRIKDPRVLTAQEHRLIGSTPDFPPRKYDPFKPQSFFCDGLSAEDTIRLRREQAIIASHSASGYFGFRGLEIRRYAVVIRLSDIDEKTGEVIDKRPKLVGIYDEDTHSIITDPEVLGRHHLTRRGMRRLLIEERN